MNDSTKALSVGLPRREVDLRSISLDPQAHRLTGERAAVVTEHQLRQTMLVLEAVGGSYDIVFFQALSRLDRNSFL